MSDRILRILSWWAQFKADAYRFELNGVDEMMYKQWLTTNKDIIKTITHRGDEFLDSFFGKFIHSNTTVSFPKWVQVSPQHKRICRCVQLH